MFNSRSILKIKFIIGFGIIAPVSVLAVGVVVSPNCKAVPAWIVPVVTMPVILSVQ